MTKRFRFLGTFENDTHEFSKDKVQFDEFVRLHDILAIASFQGVASDITDQT